MSQRLPSGNRLNDRRIRRDFLLGLSGLLLAGSALACGVPTPSRPAGTGHIQPPSSRSVSRPLETPQPPPGSVSRPPGPTPLPPPATPYPQAPTAAPQPDGPPPPVTTQPEERTSPQDADQDDQPDRCRGGRHSSASCSSYSPGHRGGMMPYPGTSYDDAASLFDWLFGL